MADIMHAGCITFLISVCNSDAVVAHLLWSTDAKCMLLSQNPGMQKLAAAALQKLKARYEHADIQMIPMPSFETLYSTSTSAKLLSLIQNNMLETQALIMYSSDSTAFPKPISFTYKIMMQSDLMGAIHIAWMVFAGSSLQSAIDDRLIQKGVCLVSLYRHAYITVRTETTTVMLFLLSQCFSFSSDLPLKAETIGSSPLIVLQPSCSLRKRMEFTILCSRQPQHINLLF
ncbi:uncharacterized protein BT62DRAFT_919187 [Guyanagaster necrorhizus]|uniref:Uncharacterized protein n=1 Tax=Guyanagaster necrorhizus TaxID=856835 RepID=A0A9P7VW52_9AGAR|nr:uncharacterized protein BT62DRAFT_919187 [Guyanagaster necrorhizus MCA 3950]KAG7447254.1 hypothetical protein BT62DRAFT_919187 [Guyanagaster necrorhizus MCA 3950]